MPPSMDSGAGDRASAPGFTEDTSAARPGADRGAHPGAHPGAPKTPGYEPRDANTFGVLMFLGVLALTLAAIFLFTWGLFRQFSVSDETPGPGSAFANVREIPQGPVLQVTPREDLQQNVARQQLKIETYGWENRQTGTVRIPIEQAMDLLLKKGLPVSASAASGAEGAAFSAKPREGDKPSPVRGGESDGPKGN